MFWFLVITFCSLFLFFIAIIIGVAIFYYKQYKKKTGSAEVIEVEVKKEPKKRGALRRFWEDSKEIGGALLPLTPFLILFLLVVLVASKLPRHSDGDVRVVNKPEVQHTEYYGKLIGN